MADFFCVLWSLWFGILVTERWLVSVVEPSRSAPTKRNVMEPKCIEKCEIEFISGHGKKMIGDAVGANNYSPLQNIWKYLILRVLDGAVRPCVFVWVRFLRGGVRCGISEIN